MHHALKRLLALVQVHAVLLGGPKDQDYVLALHTDVPLPAFAVLPEHLDDVSLLDAPIEDGLVEVLPVEDEERYCGLLIAEAVEEAALYVADFILSPNQGLLFVRPWTRLR